ncbi:hypothetical protein Bbelb_020710 [Branchiostoma belcheri]|nr:hypothetical protein Bbelb_020710 [Branchiostoma belcheri]
MSTRTTLHEATDNTRYAYDINLSRNIPCAEVVTDSTMQEEALQLDSWAATNNIIMNGDKSYELRICFARNPPKPPPLILGKTEVPVSRREEAARTLLTQMRASHLLHYMVTSDRREETKKDEVQPHDSTQEHGMSTLKCWLNLLRMNNRHFLLKAAASVGLDALAPNALVSTSSLFQIVMTRGRKDEA